MHDVDEAADALGVTEIDTMDWGRDFEVDDPDGNRIRIGESGWLTHRSLRPGRR